MFDTNKDGIIHLHEVKKAYCIKEAKEKLTKTVCKHKSEWSYTLSELSSEIATHFDYYIDNDQQSGEVIDNLNSIKDEKLKIIEEQAKALMFWDEASSVSVSDDRQDKKEVVARQPVFSNLLKPEERLVNPQTGEDYKESVDTLELE